MFEPIIPRSLHYFPRVTLVLFPARIAQQADVVVHVKVEQGARLAAGFVDYKVVKCV